MSATTLTEVENQIQKYWAPVATNKLRETLLLAELVSKDYEGEIKKAGDTVYVSQVDDLDGQNLTVGTDADAFATEKVTTTRVAVQANKRAVVAVEFNDLVELQSQIDKDSVRDPMLYALNKQINTYLYSLVSPSSSSPDHIIAPASGPIAVADMGTIRKLAGEAKWDSSKPWVGLLSPAYNVDLATNTTLASGDYQDGMPLVGGQAPRKLMGFNLFEDTSRTGDYGLFFHPDFMYFVRQTQVQVKISDLHPLGRFGFKMSIDIVYGAALGLSGSLKHIKITG